MFRETEDLSDEVRRLFDELDRQHPRPCSLVTAECTPPVDVLETPEGAEIVVDLPGVAPESIRIVIRGGTLLIVGTKTAAAPCEEATFHLAERTFGRFARAVRLGDAFEFSRADATIRAGELRVRLPRLEERRGRPIVVPIRRVPDA